MLNPSGWSASFMRLARRCAATAACSRSSSPTSIRSAEWARGTTRAWPGVAGLMSMKETVCLSESTIWAGTSPATMPQNRQSFTRRNLFRWGREPPRELDGLVSRRDLARVLRGLDLPQQPPDLGAGLDTERGGQLVAADERRGRAVPAPVERRPDDVARGGEVGLDHLRGRDRPGAARREAVGHAQEGDVNGNRLRRPQVLVDRPRRERLLRGEEAEPEMVERQAAHV